MTTTSLQFPADRAGRGGGDGAVRLLLPLLPLLPLGLLPLQGLLRLLRRPLPLRHRLLRLHPARTLPRLVGLRSLWFSIMAQRYPSHPILELGDFPFPIISPME